MNGFRISVWFDLGSLLTGFERPCRPKYSIDFESIFGRVWGCGVRKGVFFRVATPPESRCVRVAPQHCWQSDETRIFHRWGIKFNWGKILFPARWDLSRPEAHVKAIGAFPGPAFLYV